MIPFIKDCYFLSRKNNVIIANLIDGKQVPLIRLKQKFIDILIMEREVVDYMERYMAMYPDLWENYKEEEIKQQGQLTLF